MNIILATGIYPPAIGGPATYSRQLAKRLTAAGHDVTVVTYAEDVVQDEWPVEKVSSKVPLLRWWWYSQKLQEVAQDADMVYAFSSVSCGIPIILSGIKCKRVLRLGGDFFWERYTDNGGKKSLKEWYQSGGGLSVVGCRVMGWILRRFDHIIFSTDFQKDIYKESYKKLPKYSVIENALELEHVVPMEHHSIQEPFRMLFFGRFVHFKNIPSLIEAAAMTPDGYLTIVGDGPLDNQLRSLVERLGIDSRVRFVAPLSGKEKYEVFGKHDLLILPSLTDISPNTALEARSVGLPVLLTEENGLSHHLRAGMHVADISTTGKLVAEIGRVRDGYSLIAEAAAKKIDGRSWEIVANETMQTFSQL